MTDKLRVLFALHAHLSNEGGASGVTKRLSDEYANRGHDVHHLSFDDLPDGLGAPFKALLFPHLVAHRLRSSWNRFDVVDASTGDLAWFRRREKSSRRPLLVTRSHGLEHALHDQNIEESRAGRLDLSWRYPLYNGGYRLTEVKRSLTQADLCLLLNHRDRIRVISEFGIEPRRATVVRNGLPNYLLGLPAPTTKSPSHGLELAVIGTFIARKGIVPLTAALNELLPAHPSWRVRLIGTGVNKEDILPMFESSVRHQLIVNESYNNHELPSILRDAQIQLFPTLFEGAPLALLEAMACGLAPIVSDIPGPREVISNGTNGLLIPPMDADAIVSAVESLATAPDRLFSLRLAAHQSAQRYAWSSIADEQLRLYDTTVQINHH